MMDHVTTAVANTAFSLTLSGNSGISPFLTMFLIGMVGKIQPESLNLGETMDKIMTSWPSLVFWSVMTVLESVGKCVPVLDQIMDSAEAFIVPILSTLGSLSAFGSFNGSFDADSDGNGDGDGNSTNSQEVNNGDYNADDYNRMRALSSASSTSPVANGAMIFLQIVLVIFGIILAISIHFFKMLIRLLGEGCLTQCITVLEATTVCISVLVSIFVRQFAIFVAACLLIAAGYNAKKRWDKWQEKKKLQEAAEQAPQQTRSLENDENDAAAATTNVTDEYVRIEDKETDGLIQEVGETGSAQV